MRYNLASREFIFENGACPECTTSECDEIQLNATIMKCSRSKMHANAHRSKNASGIECSRYRIYHNAAGTEFILVRMHPNSARAECNTSENAPECKRMHPVQCTQNAPTEMQRKCSNQNECNVSEMHQNST